MKKPTERDLLPLNQNLYLQTENDICDSRLRFYSIEYSLLFERGKNVVDLLHTHEAETVVTDKTIVFTRIKTSCVTMPFSIQRVNKIINHFFLVF